MVKSLNMNRKVGSIGLIFVALAMIALAFVNNKSKLAAYVVNPIKKVNYKEISSIGLAKTSREIVFEDMDMDELAAKLERSLSSDLVGEGHNLARLSIKYNVDPYLGLAIILHETGCSSKCSNLARECHNYGGMKGVGCNSYQKFATREAGLEAFYKNLKTNYIDQGRVTSYDINQKYAANPNWHITIDNYINKIKAK